VVGVNRFTDDEPPPVIAMPDFAELAERQRARLGAVRARRDAGRVASALDAVRGAAASAAPIMPTILEAVRSRATLGEISDVLRDVWGTYRPGR
jgi:methylmalonyl-CoA mutase, N-terminal domain